MYGPIDDPARMRPSSSPTSKRHEHQINCTVPSKRVPFLQAYFERHVPAAGIEGSVAMVKKIEHQDAFRNPGFSGLGPVHRTQLGKYKPSGRD